MEIDFIKPIKKIQSAIKPIQLKNTRIIMID